MGKEERYLQYLLLSLKLTMVRQVDQDKKKRMNETKKNKKVNKSLKKQEIQEESDQRRLRKLDEQMNKKPKSRKRNIGRRKNSTPDKQIAQHYPAVMPIIHQLIVKIHCMFWLGVQDPQEKLANQFRKLDLHYSFLSQKRQLLRRLKLIYGTSSNILYWFHRLKQEQQTILIYDILNIILYWFAKHNALPSIIMDKYYHHSDGQILREWQECLKDQNYNPQPVHEELRLFADLALNIIDFQQIKVKKLKINQNHTQKNAISQSCFSIGKSEDGRLNSTGTKNFKNQPNQLSSPSISSEFQIFDN